MYCILTCLSFLIFFEYKHCTSKDYRNHCYCRRIELIFLMRKRQRQQAGRTGAQRIPDHIGCILMTQYNIWLKCDNNMWSEISFILQSLVTQVSTTLSKTSEWLFFFSWGKPHGAGQYFIVIYYFFNMSKSTRAIFKLQILRHFLEIAQMILVVQH